MTWIHSYRRIVSVELENFKSFLGHKHLIGPFSMLTAIIGPNGSGKWFLTIIANLRKFFVNTFHLIQVNQHYSKPSGMPYVFPCPKANTSMSETSLAKLQARSTSILKRCMFKLISRTASLSGEVISSNPKRIHSNS